LWLDSFLQKARENGALKLARVFFFNILGDFDFLTNYLAVLNPWFIKIKQLFIINRKWIFDFGQNYLKITSALIYCLYYYNVFSLVKVRSTIQSQS
jgi:hypothetical protein